MFTLSNLIPHVRRVFATAAVPQVVPVACIETMEGRRLMSGDVVPTETFSLNFGDATQSLSLNFTKITFSEANGSGNPNPSETLSLNFTNVE